MMNKLTMVKASMINRMYIGYNIWVNPDDSNIKDVGMNTIMVALAAVALGIIFYAGTFFILFKFAVALYNFVAATENPHEQAGFKQDMKEALIGGVMFYLVIFLTQYVSVMTLTLIDKEGYATVITALKSFWSVWTNLRKSIGLGI